MATEAERTAVELIEGYRAELARLYGEDLAKASHIEYHRGWFRMNIAHRGPEGRLRTPYYGEANIRRKDLEHRIAELGTRQPADNSSTRGA